MGKPKNFLPKNHRLKLKEPFEYTFLVYRNSGKNHDIAGRNSGVTNRCVDQLFNLDLSGFNLPSKTDIQNKDNKYIYSDSIKIKLIEIVFRIKGKKEKTTFRST